LSFVAHACAAKRSKKQDLRVANCLHKSSRERSFSMRTVVGVFPNRADADHVVDHLIHVGVPPDDVTVADAIAANGHEWSERNLAACGGLSMGWFMAWMIPMLTKRTFPGATAFGAATGAVGGAIAGLFAIGIGSPASAALTMFLGIATGVGFGALIAGIYNMGVTHEEIPLQAEAAREHGVVVAAHVDLPRADATYTLMQEHGARALRADADAWKASGWSGTAVPDEPYPSDSTVRRHAA
jgi:hypothetical protein